MGKGQRLEEELDGHLRSLSRINLSRSLLTLPISFCSSQWRTTLMERRKLFLSTRIDSSVKCFLERTLSSLCSEIPSSIHGFLME
ncbi:hypothetical protein MUK42_02058 [Musa troglodytarum]|uniref:Uncharacterized protein n=1 Tax=Musa troglodytarum TaxID=320322 RepID=A0A9E7FXR6_9LILI|nr:hypothetical protein MUK42_02058 [Musa troglodytarum]URE02370.1 hypothetical protein MUK42_02058 [Musa troglodytarum]